MINVQGKTIDELFQEADKILKHQEITQEKMEIWKNGCKRQAKQEIIKMETQSLKQTERVEHNPEEKIYVPQKSFNLKSILLALGIALLIAIPLFILQNLSGEVKYTDVYLKNPILAQSQR